MRPAILKTIFLTPQDLERVEHHPFLKGTPLSKLKLLRDWQIEAFEKLKDAEFCYFTAFMGSGKSLLMKYLAAYELIKSGGTQKQIILVPLSSLHKGFRGEVLLIDEVEWEWALGTSRDLCSSDNTSDSIVNDLIQAIVEPLDSYHEYWDKRSLFGRIVVTTDLALAFAWTKMTPEQREIAIGNGADFGITYNKDEGHRVLMPDFCDDDEFDDDEFDDDEFDDDEFDDDGVLPTGELPGNIIGTIFSKVTESKRGHLRLGTGTFTRGYQRRTILGGFEHLFKDHYDQDFVKYYETLGVEYFQMTSHVYKNEKGVPELLDFLRSQIEEFVKNGTKWMLMLPHRKQGWREEGGFDESTNYGADVIFNLLYEYIDPERVLDFASQSPSKRKEAKKALDEEPEDGDERPSRFDVAVGVDCLQMGVDWPECSAVINTANDRSIISLLQKPGRAFRKFHSKRSIHIFSCIPEFIPKKNMTRRDVMSDYVNQTLAHFFMRDLYEPIVFTGLDGNTIRIRGHWRKGGKYEKICSEIQEMLRDLELLKPEMTLTDTLPYIESIIEQYDPEFPHDELRLVATKFLQAQLKSRNIVDLPRKKTSGQVNPDYFKATDVSFFRTEEDFDKVTLGDISLYKTHNMTGETLQEVQDIIRSRYHWDSRYDRALETFKRLPGVKAVCVIAVQHNSPVRWAEWNLPPPVVDDMEWAIGQQRRALAGDLTGQQALLMKKLFTPDPRPAPTQPQQPVVQPVPRRPSW